MKDDNVDDDDKDENDNGIIGATAAAAAPATATTTHNFPFVWHVKMCGVSVKLHFKKEKKKTLSILISFQYVDMRIEHGFEISYDLH